MDKRYLLNNKSLERFLLLLPNEWKDSLMGVDLVNLNEIRIRANQPIIVKVFNDNRYLINVYNKKFIIPTFSDVEEIVYLVCNKSIYAYVHQLINGYVPFGDGVRIGVCGEYVRDCDKIIGIKNFSSINVRVPHEIKNCTITVKDKLIDPLKSVLVISKPACGKTTFLRDLIYQLKNKNINTLIVDEREEIVAINNGKSMFELNDTFDVITNCSKKSAFITGIRSMSPNLIVCDELVNDDVFYLNEVIQSGVKVFASVHADNLNNAIIKLNLKSFNEIFDRFVVLSDARGVGTIEGIYDNQQNKLL